MAETTNKHEGSIRQVLVFVNDDGGYTARAPSLPNMEGVGATLDAALRQLRAQIHAYTVLHGAAPSLETQVDLGYAAVDVTPPNVTDFQVFAPTPPQPLTPAAEAWARQVIQDLRDAGRVDTKHR